MLRDNALTTAEIGAVFAEEITAAGGTVTDTFDDGARLLSRSVLPSLQDVRPKDRVQGGVALRATETDIWVHPYVYRLVCRNGAIMAQAIQTEHIQRLDTLTAEEAGWALREAIGACCVEEAFTEFADEMRSAQTAQGDLAIYFLPQLFRLPVQAREHILAQVFTRLNRDGDRSRFGLMNAVTSVARDTADPELRWRLEELGGGVLVDRDPTPQLHEFATAALASA